MLPKLQTTKVHEHRLHHNLPLRAVKRELNPERSRSVEEIENWKIALEEKLVRGKSRPKDLFQYPTKRLLKYTHACAKLDLQLRQTPTDRQLLDRLMEVYEVVSLKAPKYQFKKAVRKLFCHFFNNASVVRVFGHLGS
jgi:hypothetical protein